MKTSLATPRLVVNEAIVRRNLARLADYTAQHGLNFRPHTKTHKSQRVGRMQVEAGAVGLTVAKVGEAEVMAQAADDLLLAYPVADAVRGRRVAALAQHKTVRVAVDTKVTAASLAESARAAPCTIGVLVDIDVGMHRTGVQSPEEALALAQYIDRTAGLRLDGIFCFPGHINGPAEDQTAGLQAVSDMLAATIDQWVSHGLDPAIISGGSTPTAYQSHLVPELTEIRPGTNIYNDWNCAAAGYCSLEDCAATVICTVMSDAVPDKVVIDGGSKTFSSDLCSPRPESGFGYIVEYPEARIRRLTEEHGEVDVSACSNRPQVGEQVTVIPNHICPCVNLHDQCYWQTDSGDVEVIPIDARGKIV